MNKSFLSIASLLGALSVALGAFAAHKLKEMVSADDVAIFDTGVRYQFYHVFALFIVAMLSEKFNNRWMTRAGNCFIAGIVLFSGSLYVMTALKAAETGGLRVAAIITPIGGVFFILGWIFLWLGINKRPE